MNELDQAAAGVGLAGVLLVLVSFFLAIAVDYTRTLQGEQRMRRASLAALWLAITLLVAAVLVEVLT